MKFCSGTGNGFSSSREQSQHKETINIHTWYFLHLPHLPHSNLYHLPSSHLHSLTFLIYCLLPVSLLETTLVFSQSGLLWQGLLLGWFRRPHILACILKLLRTFDITARAPTCISHWFEPLHHRQEDEVREQTCWLSLIVATESMIHFQCGSLIYMILFNTRNPWAKGKRHTKLELNSRVQGLRD